MATWFRVISSLLVLGTQHHRHVLVSSQIIENGVIISSIVSCDQWDRVGGGSPNYGPGEVPKAYHFDCQSNPTIQCPSNSECNVHCEVDIPNRRLLQTGGEACADITVNCPSSALCRVHCTHSCQGITIHAETSSQLIVVGCGGSTMSENGCNEMDIFCPAHNGNGVGNTCTIGGGIVSSSISQLHIHAQEAFYDVDLNALQLSGDGNRMHCGDTANEYECVIDTNTNNDCVDTSSKCQDYQYGSVTDSPTGKPTNRPTQKPTQRPTDIPTNSPTPVSVTDTPTKSPFKSDTNTPTKGPTKTPIKAPTLIPTTLPTQTVTDLPTQNPIKSPTNRPNESATENPSEFPTKDPTAPPTNNPTLSSVVYPTMNPIADTTSSSTILPSKAPIHSSTEATENVTEYPTSVDEITSNPTLNIDLPSASPVAATAYPSANPSQTMITTIGSVLGTESVETDVSAVTIDRFVSDDSNLLNENLSIFIMIGGGLVLVIIVAAVIRIIMRRKAHIAFEKDKTTKQDTMALDHTIPMTPTGPTQKKMFKTRTVTTETVTAVASMTENEMDQMILSEPQQQQIMAEESLQLTNNEIFYRNSDKDVNTKMLSVTMSNVDNGGIAPAIEPIEESDSSSASSYATGTDPEED